MLAKIVSPPTGGTVFRLRIEPIGGSGSHDTSECQRSPAMRLEFASAWIGRISGCPSGPWRVRMDVQFAEQAAERLVLVERQLLVAEEDHLMRHQRVVHFLELLVAERLAEIDTEDLRADRGGGTASPQWFRRAWRTLLGCFPCRLFQRGRQLVQRATTCAGTRSPPRTVPDAAGRPCRTCHPARRPWC